MDGYVKTHRSILDWRYIDDPVMFSLFIQLILRANYTPKVWKDIVINRGQLVTTIDKLSVFIGAKAGTIRNKLKELVSGGEIAIKTTNKFTVITICNYDIYQAQFEEGLQTNCEQNKNNLQTNCEQIATTKEYKENNNFKNNIKETNTCVLVKKNPDKPDQPAPEQKLKPKKESAIVHNTKLYNEALKHIQENKDDSYSRFILWMNDEHSTILYSLRLMSRKTYEDIRKQYSGERIKEVVAELENRPDKYKHYSELGATLRNWLRPKA